MHKNLADDHSREQFQVDRIAFFSDAVIAIAITLLVLEIKIPSIGKNASWHDIQTVYSKQLIHPFLGLFLSFFMIGRLWIRHHELFEFITHCNRILIRYNLYFLFSIVLLPVSTVFMMDKDNPKGVGSVVFIMNLGLCQLFFVFLLQTILNKMNIFYSRDVLEKIRRQRSDCLLFMAFLFVLAILILTKVEWAGYFIYLFTAFLILRRLKYGGPHH